MKQIASFVPLTAILLLTASAPATPPQLDEVYPKPDAAERAKLESEFPAFSKGLSPAFAEWARMGIYGFAHFGLGTDDTNGAGIRKPENFNPTRLDGRKWVKTFRDVGCPMLLLTTKHHDGFCLWNSRYTKYSVASSPWKDGKGDVLRELSDACRAEGIKMGLYFSLVTGNERHKGGIYGNGSKAVECVIPTTVVGRPFPAGHREFTVVADDYNRYIMNQLYELFTEYGPIAEIWFDMPFPSPEQPYDMDIWHNMVRELSPDTVLVGYNAHGLSGGVKRKPGEWRPPDSLQRNRPDWFYRVAENDFIRPQHILMKDYLNLAGAGRVMGLNVPPDGSGQLREPDVKTMIEFGALRRKTFGNQGSPLWNDGKPNPLNLAEGAPAALLDNNAATVWEPQNAGPWSFEFKAKGDANLFMAEEDMLQGPRVRAFVLDCKTGADWKEIAKGTTIGGRCILQTPAIAKDSELRLRITSAKAKPCLTEIGLFQYDEPPFPSIHRGADGRVVIEGRAGTVFHYTLDGTEPTLQSPVYAEPIALPQGGRVRAFGVWNGKTTDSVSIHVGLPKTQWKIVSVTSEDKNAPVADLLDESPNTVWHSQAVEGRGKKKASAYEPQTLVIDLGGPTTAAGFEILPCQDTARNWGFPKDYELYLGNDLANLGKPVLNDRFYEMLDNPIQQTFHFKNPVTGRYLKLVFKTSCAKLPDISAADIGLLWK